MPQHSASLGNNLPVLPCPLLDSSLLLGLALSLSIYLARALLCKRTGTLSVWLAVCLSFFFFFSLFFFFFVLSLSLSLSLFFSLKPFSVFSPSFFLSLCLSLSLYFSLFWGGFLSFFFFLSLSLSLSLRTLGLVIANSARTR